MSVVIEKLRKRRHYPVEGLDGVYVRLLTLGEKAEQLQVNQKDRRKRDSLVKALESATTEDAVADAREDLERHDALGISHFFTLGLILVDETGAAVVPRAPDELASHYAARVSHALGDADELSLKLIGQAYADLVKSGEARTLKQLEAAAKN